MAFPGVDQLSGIPDFFLQGGLPSAVAPVLPDFAANIITGGPQIQPVIPQLPSYQSALANKYGDPQFQQFFTTLPQELQNSLIQFDAKRVSVGSAPVSMQDTVSIANAAAQQQVPKEGTGHSLWNIPGNFLSDLKAVVGSVPRLFDPRTWLHELAAIPSIGDSIFKAQENGANILQAVAQAPGVRMLPGAFLAGNITSPEVLAQHPLFTALDLIPTASHLAEGSSVVRAARAAEEAANLKSAAFSTSADEAKAIGAVERERAARNSAMIEAQNAIPKNAIGIALASKLDEAGNVVRSPLGETMDSLLGQTRAGRAIKETFGYRDAWTYVSNQEARNNAIRNGLVEPQTPFEEFTREAQKLAEDSKMPEAERIDFTRRMELGEISTMTADELALKQKYDDLVTKFAVASGEDRLMQFDGEWYPTRQAQQLHERRLVADHKARVTTLRDEMLIPSKQFTPDMFRSATEEAFKAGTSDRIKSELDAVRHAMDAYGYEVKPIRDAMNIAVRGKSGAYYAVSDAINNVLDAAHAPGAIPPIPRWTLPDMLAELRRTGNNPQAKALEYALQDKNPTRITKALNNLRNQKMSRPSIINDPVFLESVRSYRTRIGWENRRGVEFTAGQVAKSEREAVNLQRAMYPAKYAPRILHEAQGELSNQLFAKFGATPDQVGEIAQHVLDTNWAAADRALGSAEGTVSRLYGNIKSDVAKTWMDMRADKTIDPSYVHHVSRARASQVVSPRLSPIPNEITQWMERSLDMTPTVNDWAVSITHQGMEMLQRTATENMIHYVMQKYGIRQGDLQETYLPYVNTERSLNVHQQMRDIVGTRYARFNPDTARGNWGGVNLDQYRQEVVFIPQSLQSALDRLNRPKSNLAQVMDPVTKTFRIAVVGLSPRTQLYNILGGATMITGQAGLGVWKYMSQAREAMRNPEILNNEVMRAEMGSMTREFLDSDITKANAVTSYLFGRSARRLAEQADAAGLFSQSKSFLNGVAEKSFALNGYFDDLYRTMAYLYGYDKSITRGMAEETAKLAGEQLMRKSMMDWVSLSPVERDILKSIFPFYGFMRHAIGYVLRYPFDHPLRAAVLGAFGHAELNDLGGLPLSHLAMVPVPGSEKNADGTRQYLSLGAVNPFGDVANMMTVAGFVGALNPVISTMLESVGVASNGTAELYPTMRYDPDTGRLNAVHPNLLEAFAQNTIPQTAILTAALGINRDFNERMVRDPQGALRTLLSSAGMPPLPRDININQEFFKAELNRLQSVASVRNTALKSGDWGDASQYPSLAAVLAQLESSSPDQLQKYTAPTPESVIANIHMALSPVVYPGKSVSVPNLSGI